MTRAFSKMNCLKFDTALGERLMNKRIWQNPLLERSLLDSTIVELYLLEGLVGTLHLRPRNDDVLYGSPIANSRLPTPSWNQWDKLLGVTLE